MKIGSKEVKPTEVKDQLLNARRVYLEGKQKAFEQSITYAESRSSWLFALLFASLALAGWMVAIFLKPPIDKTFDLYRFLPLTVYFFISYFAFFHFSKLIFKPSEEEFSDDTSYLALFSACAARERRGLYAAAFGVLNTFALTLYVLVSQTGPDAWRLF